MANGSGKLVNNLAESLVDALSESKDLNLMNNERFGEFTDLLQSLSTKIDESKKQNSDKIEAETQLLYDALLAVLSDISGRVYRVDDLSKFKNKDIHKEGGKTVRLTGNARICRSDIARDWTDTFDVQPAKNENRIGKWNTAEIVCMGDTAEFYFNNELVNSIKRLSPSRGKIQLQSEGCPIEFRRIAIKTY